MIHLALLLTLALASPAGDTQAQGAIALAKGQLAYNNKEYSRALKLLLSAKKLAPAQPELHFWLGMTHLKLGHLRRAEKALIAAVEGGSADAATAKTLGELQLRLKKYTWAMRSLSGSLELNPKDEGVRLSLAYTLMALEEYDDAIKLLRRVRKKGSRDQRERARTLLGIARYRQKKYAAARLILAAGGAGSNQRNPLRATILSAIVSRELGLRRGYSGSVTLSTGFDSNPALNADPDRSVITASDGALASTLFGWLSYQPTKALSAELSFGRTFYLAPWDTKTQERVSSFNLTTLELGGMYRYRYLAEGHHRRLDAGYLFSLTALDGGEGIPSEADPFLFSERHSLIFTWHHAARADHSMEFTISPSYTAFRDEDRDAFDMKASVKWSLFYSKNRYKLFPLIYGGKKAAAWAPWSSWYGGLWVGFSTVGPQKSDITASASWQMEYFPDSKLSASGETAPIWGLSGDEARSDNILTAAIAISKRFFGDSLRATLSARYQNNHSTASYFDYDRVIFLFSVSGKLDRTKEAP